MTDLYVANLTKQHFLFMYRVLNNDGTWMQQREFKIPIGEQIRIPEKLTDAQIADIIDKQKPYGFPDVLEMKNKRGYTGLCYSLDKPVQLEHFMLGHESNESALEKSGEMRLEAQAVAISERLSKVSDQTPLTHAAVENVEETKGGARGVAVGVEVAAPGAQPRHPEGRETRRRVQ